MSLTALQQAGRSVRSGMPASLTVAVLHGDQTGEELLAESLRLMTEELLSVPVTLEHFDLSLDMRRDTRNGIVADAAAAIRRLGLGIKAATITPETAGDVGSPNRLLREGIDGKVIVRAGRKLPGIPTVAGVQHPISVVRMATGDAYGAEEWRDEHTGEAFRTERITDVSCAAVAEHAFQLAAVTGATVLGGPKFTVSPVYEGLLKEHLDRVAAEHPDVPYRPMLIDALYAALISGGHDRPLVIPALNRDGDCLTDLVLPMFGSIAGAESVLVGDGVMVEAPHGTAPDLFGTGRANPLAMILSVGALLRHAGLPAQSQMVYEAALETVASGCRTGDLSGSSTMTQVTDEVICRMQVKAQIAGL